MTGRIGVVMVGRVSRIVGHVSEWLAGGSTASGDEDLVRSESEVGIGQLSGELAKGRSEIGGRPRRHCQRRRWTWLCYRWRSGVSLGVTKGEVSEEMSHCLSLSQWPQQLTNNSYVKAGR